MKEKETIYVNLISGPGAGKSTAMAGIFYGLKKLGISCEMVPEFAKEKVWEECFHTMDDQLYIFAKQHHKLWRLNGKVNVVVTDGSLLNSLVYGEDESGLFHPLVMDRFNSFNNFNFFIERSFDSYEVDGRVETKEESILIDGKYLDALDKWGVDYVKIRNIDAADFIIKQLIELNVL